MLTVNFKGELGNNLFQVAAVLGSKEVGFVPHDSVTGVFFSKRRDCYISNEDRPLEFDDMFEYEFPYSDHTGGHVITHEDNDTSNGMNWAYHDFEDRIAYISNPVVRLDGYFQSPKYFDHIRDDLLNKYFVFRQEIRNRMDEKYPNIGNCIALHVRRGGDRKALEYNHGSVSMEYYQRSLNVVLDLAKTIPDKVMVFSDDPTWCEDMFVGDDYEIVSGNANYEDMYLITQASHVIMANSTFSWWGAYLNQNDEKIVTYPTNEWFGPGLRHLCLKDMFPNEWIGV